MGKVLNLRAMQLVFTTICLLLISPVSASESGAPQNHYYRYQVGNAYGYVSKLSKAQKYEGTVTPNVTWFVFADMSDVPNGENERPKFTVLNSPGDCADATKGYFDFIVAFPEKQLAIRGQASIITGAIVQQQWVPLTKNSTIWGAAQDFTNKQVTLIPSHVINDQCKRQFANSNGFAY